MKIVIVGGVAGGASAATRARRMNEAAEIIVLEKDAHVSFANCGLPYYIGEEIAEREKLLVATPEFLARRFRLDVRTQSEAIAIDPDEKSVTVRQIEDGRTYQQPYDKLILAPGASPLVPPIEGVEADNVMTLRNLDDTDRIKSVVDGLPTGHATVVGAGYIGLEMVEQLARRGWRVTLVELQDQVLPLLDREMAQPVAAELTRHGIELRLGAGLEQVQCDKQGRAVAARLPGDETIATDLVILGIGVRPNHQLAKEAGLELGTDGGIVVNEFSQTSDPDIYAVGDVCQYAYGPTGQKMRVALAGPANRAGRLAGEHAATGKSQPMQPVWGTSIVRVFGITAGMTGLTARGADRCGVEMKTVTVIGKHHAGYFPGAESMTVKLGYSPEGRVLGVQVVGGEGVDKRVDVIATAMHLGATVEQLAGLDLAYAPPFGAAKDPIHQAAFAAGNELAGVTDFVPVDADLSEYQVVDVRSAGEVERSPLKGAPDAIHIPVDELRERMNELDQSRPTVVSCGVGVRGHVAARMLRQHGFDVCNLTGGATLRDRVFV